MMNIYERLAKGIGGKVILAKTHDIQRKSEKDWRK